MKNYVSLENIWLRIVVCQQVTTRYGILLAQEGVYNRPLLASHATRQSFDWLYAGVTIDGFAPDWDRGFGR